MQKALSFMIWPMIDNGFLHFFFHHWHVNADVKPVICRFLTSCLWVLGLCFNHNVFPSWLYGFYFFLFYYNCFQQDDVDAKVIVAGHSTTCSQKIHNQLVCSKFRIHCRVIRHLPFFCYVLGTMPYFVWVEQAWYSELDYLKLRYWYFILFICCKLCIWWTFHLWVANLDASKCWCI